MKKKIKKSFSCMTSGRRGGERWEDVQWVVVDDGMKKRERERTKKKDKKKLSKFWPPRVDKMLITCP